MLEPSTLTQMEQTSARVKFTVHWIQIVGFMISWFIEWSQRSLLQHVVLSIIPIKSVKLVMKEMHGGWSL